MYICISTLDEIKTFSLIIRLYEILFICKIFEILFPCLFRIYHLFCGHYYYINNQIVFTLKEFNFWEIFLFIYVSCSKSLLVSTP